MIPSYSTAAIYYHILYQPGTSHSLNSVLYSKSTFKFTAFKCWNCTLIVFFFSKNDICNFMWSTKVSINFLNKCNLFFYWIYHYYYVVISRMFFLFSFCIYNFWRILDIKNNYFQHNIDDINSDSFFIFLCDSYYKKSSFQWEMVPKRYDL